jgi:uncharacterized protein with LGFP repeats
VLGFPLSEEKEVRSGPGTGGRYQEFEGGRIYFGYVDGARAIEVVGDLGALHQALDGAEGRFGFPTAPADDGAEPADRERSGVRGWNSGRHVPSRFLMS